MMIGQMKCASSSCWSSANDDGVVEISHELIPVIGVTASVLKLYASFKKRTKVVIAALAQTFSSSISAKVKCFGIGMAGLGRDEVKYCLPYALGINREIPAAADRPNQD